MKFLIVGMGSIGRRHFKNLRLLGHRDISSVRSKRGMDQEQKEFFQTNRPRVFHDLRQALKEKPNVVLVCNPTSLHVRTAMQAIRANAHVFIEKPISHSLAGVDQLIAEANKRKKKIAVGYHFRYHPQLLQIKKLISEKKLGTVFFARFFTGEYLPNWHPRENYKKGYAARKDLGGGVVLTQSHDLDMALWLLGKPKRVRSDVRSSGLLGIDIDDVAEMIYECEPSTVVSVHLDYLSQPPMKYMTIVGTKGRIEWNNDGHLRFTTSRGIIKNFALSGGFTRNQMYADEMRDFIRDIRKGFAFQGANGTSGREVLKMALAAKGASKKFLTL